MIPDHSYADEFEYYEEQFDPLRTDRQARRRRKPKVRHVPKKPRSQIIAELADLTGLEGGFCTTYQPSRYEEGWLLSSLRAFYDDSHITDILALIKGGKEASVYCCEGDPSTGLDLLAAKVYRPRQFRALRNDAMYRQGREVLLLSEMGYPVGTADGRILRAIRNKTSFGVQVQQTSWLMHEYEALACLYEAGAAVPQPIAAGENAILMSYCGDEQMAAPTLNEVSLEPGEATALFKEVLHNIEMMLHHGLIHGDLSAYNILYWAGEITIIDFPQVTKVHINRHAHAFLERDIRRVCEYFAREGVPCDPGAITDEFAARYGVEPNDLTADGFELLYLSDQEP